MLALIGLFHGSLILFCLYKIEKVIGKNDSLSHQVLLVWSVVIIANVFSIFRNSRYIVAKIKSSK